MMIEETFVTDRGRRRRRVFPVDLDAVRRGLGVPTAVASSVEAAATPE